MEDSRIEFNSNSFFNYYISSDYREKLSSSHIPHPNFLQTPVILLTEKCVFHIRGVTMGGFSIEDHLQELIINYYSGNMNRCQSDNLLVWINQDSENLEYFRQLERIWLAAGVLNEYKFDTVRAFDSIGLKRSRLPDKRK